MSRHWPQKAWIGPVPLFSAIGTTSRHSSRAAQALAPQTPGQTRSPGGQRAHFALPFNALVLHLLRRQVALAELAPLLDVVA
eukprot:631389-Heterocapsa_arctica.AAC.1